MEASNQIRIIGGDWKRTRLPVLKIDGLRPTPNRVRETVFNWLGQRLDGMTCLDLFAGSGALGFEAASRGAGHVLMVERDARIAQQLRVNRAKLSAAAIKIVQTDALRLAAQLAAKSFDIVFLDPPFNANLNLLEQALRSSFPLTRQEGAIYVEAPAPIEPLIERAKSIPDSSSAALTDSWQIMHQRKAGAVYYHLLRCKKQV